MYGRSFGNKLFDWIRLGMFLGNDDLLVLEIVALNLLGCSFSTVLSRREIFISIKMHVQKLRFSTC